AVVEGDGRAAASLRCVPGGPLKIHIIAGGSKSGVSRPRGTLFELPPQDTGEGEEAAWRIIIEHLQVADSRHCKRRRKRSRLTSWGQSRKKEPILGDTQAARFRDCGPARKAKAKMRNSVGCRPRCPRPNPQGHV